MWLLDIDILIPQGGRKVSKGTKLFILALIEIYSRKNNALFLMQ